MARPLRLEFEGAVYHITARGNARQDIFLDEEDRQQFLQLLAREVEQQGWRCYAYCLMSNHYHLLVETPEPNLSRGMRRLNGVYTQQFNRRHGRVGHLLQGRYKSILVERESYLLELCRYVVLNPVRAGMVQETSDYPWCSFAATAGYSPAPPWLDIEGVLETFHSDSRKARRAYATFVGKGTNARPWDDLRGQVWLGSAKFRERMEQLAREQPCDEIPKRQLERPRPTKSDILAQVTGKFGVDQEALFERRHPQAYQCAVYLLRREANLPLKEVAGIFGISPSRVSKIQKAVESSHDEIAPAVITGAPATK
ncbi:REP-associated tyrosine transposase [Thiohalomonas denitrificans]|uniref:REP element-mobilizing transposase RayT n=1 Tax=Thiohalomonas denitrificans TaxID=415747 RepID=A0A1G5QTS2_9GAMM|nr:transposase [Thiohalomonas denitrificans]SCZ65157.1 REP element-mobilizing transposase RayT [Thiohalomonas denitrificans]